MRGFVGSSGANSDVTLADPRRHNLRELLLDLSRPGLCLVLGAGASYGVVPMTASQIAQLAREIQEANRDYSRLPAAYIDQLQFPEVRYLTDILVKTDRGAWDRILDDFRRPGMATFVLHSVFTPSGEIPEALIRIYDVLENQNGVIISYNYDRLTDRQRRFEVIAPHGQRSALFDDPRSLALARDLALQFDKPIPSDWVLPVPEDDSVRIRQEYRKAVRAWQQASAIVLIGYGFGQGADMFSFKDFGEHAAPKSRVHVLGPMPDNADLCQQVGYGLRGRGPRFRVYGQPFRWRAFAEALLEVLDELRRSHVRFALGMEAEIGASHDRK